MINATLEITKEKIFHNCSLQVLPRKGEFIHDFGGKKYEVVKVVHEVTTIDVGYWHHSNVRIIAQEVNY